MDELTLFMDRFCRAGANAIGAYMRISGLPAGTMPEYFLSSLIFRDIGENRAVTLETPCWQILEWIEAERSTELTEPERSWKVDMIGLRR